MRPIWKGGISFGLVFIPIKLYSAVDSENLDLDLLDKRDMSRIGYKKVSKSSGDEVPQEQIVRGFEVEKGKYVILENEEIEKLYPKRSKSIEILSFTEESNIDSVYFEKPYFIEPEGDVKKAYKLLVEAIEQTGKVGVAKFVLKNREHLCILKVRDGNLILVQMRFADEIRDDNELDMKISEKPDKEEVSMAVKIINSLSKKFSAESYKDTYIKEIKEVIEKKAKKKKIEVAEEEPKATQVEELMDMLKQSLSKK
jgi:DNA end-binding protein Ku